MCGFSITKEVRNLFENDGIIYTREGPGVHLLKGFSGSLVLKLVLLDELVGDEFACFRILGKDASKEDIALFHRQILQLDKSDEEAWDRIGSILEESRAYNARKHEKLIIEGRIIVMEKSGYRIGPRTIQLNQARMTGKAEGFAEGRKEGREEGRIEMLNFLVRTGEITLSKANEIKKRAKF